MKKISEVSFVYDKFFLLRILRLRGKKESDGQYVWPTTPLRFDPDSGILHTYSGNVFQIISYEGDRDFIVAEINDTIKRKKYRLL